MSPNLSLHPAMRGVRAQGGDPVVAAIAEFATSLKDFKERYDARLIELEQKRADGLTIMPSFGGGGAGDTLASMLIKSDGWQNVAEKRATKTSINVSASQLLGAQANTIRYDSGQLDVTQRLPGIVTGPKRRRWLRDRFRSVTVTGGTVEYHRLVTFTNNAAPQGGNSPFEHEGIAKAESAITFEHQERKVATIAHFIKASKQILSDADMLQMTLDTQLRYGLELVIESQLLNGNGTGANLSGLTKSGNFTAFTPTTGDTALDSISRAIAAIETADGSPDLIIMHPVDFRAMQRITSEDDVYIYGQPGGTNIEQVWQKDIHITPAMTQGKFMVMDAAMAAVVFNREDASVVLGWVNDDFTKNLVTILAEARLCVGVTVPSVIRYGSLTA